MKSFDDPAVRRHASTALTMLRVRDPRCQVLNADALDLATGHLRSIAKATGLTPPQVCDALRIHGWRRRQLMPQSSGGLRFRLSKPNRVLTTHVPGFNRRFTPAPGAWDARPPRRQSLYRPRTQEATK